MAGIPIPEKNKARFGASLMPHNDPQPPCTDVDIIHFSPGLSLAGFETYTGIIDLAKSYDKKLRGKTFSVKGQQWQIKKVFPAGDYIKMKVFLVKAENT